MHNETVIQLWWNISIKWHDTNVDLFDGEIFEKDKYIKMSCEVISWLFLRTYGSYISAIIIYLISFLSIFSFQYNIIFIKHSTSWYHRFKTTYLYKEYNYKHINLTCIYNYHVTTMLSLRFIRPSDSLRKWRSKTQFMFK